MNTQTTDHRSDSLLDAGEVSVSMPNIYPQESRPAQVPSLVSSEAIVNFLTYPSFSTKQMALECLWKQIAQSSAAAIIHKSGQS